MQIFKEKLGRIEKVKFEIAHKYSRFTFNIDFALDGEGFFCRVKQRNSQTTEFQIIHEQLDGKESVCPLCNRTINGLVYCLDKEEKLQKETFDYLTNHPSVRLKLLSLGLTPIVKTKKPKRKKGY